MDLALTISRVGCVGIDSERSSPEVRRDDPSLASVAENIEVVVAPMFNHLSFSYFCNSEDAGKALLYGVQANKVPLVRHLLVATPILKKDREEAIFEAVKRDNFNAFKALVKNKSYVFSLDFLEKCILASLSSNTLEIASLLLEREELDLENNNFGFCLLRDLILSRNIKALQMCLNQIVIYDELFLDLMIIAVIETDSVELTAALLSSRSISNADLMKVIEMAEYANEYDSVHLIQEWMR